MASAPRLLADINACLILYDVVTLCGLITHVIGLFFDNDVIRYKVLKLGNYPGFKIHRVSNRHILLQPIARSTRGVFGQVGVYASTQEVVKSSTVSVSASRMIYQNALVQINEAYSREHVLVEMVML